MSKAFTKEEDLPPDFDPGDDEESDALPQGFKNYMTFEGAERLREELKRLLYTDRPEVVRIVSWAAGNGDRSENGDYIYGKRRMREIDRRIRFLQRRLDSCEVVVAPAQPTKKILFGAWVGIIGEDGGRKDYRIVGIDETDPKRGYISWISPVAKALLQSSEGDVAVLRTPKGEEEIEIVEVRYET